METKNEVLDGYYLLMEESGGEWEESWSIDTKSWFIEKDNGKGLSRVSQIIDEIIAKIGSCFRYEEFDTYENGKVVHFDPPVEGHWRPIHFLRLKSDRGVGVSCSLKEEGDDEWYDDYQTTTYIRFTLYNAVKIGDKIFREVKILDESPRTILKTKD